MGDEKKIIMFFAGKALEMATFGSKFKRKDNIKIDIRELFVKT